MQAPGVCWLQPSSGSTERCEMPAILSTRLVTWPLTCEASVDSAPKFPGAGLAAEASEVLPKARRLMMSEGGSEGSDRYVVCRRSLGPWNCTRMLYCWMVVVTLRLTFAWVS